MRETKPSVGNFIGFFQITIDLEVIIRKILGLIDLTKAQIFCIYKSTDIIILYKNENLIFLAFQIVPPGFKNFNNRQKLIIMSFVLYFN